MAKDSTSAAGVGVGREINPDGTVASETRRGHTTFFHYDSLSRPTLTTPPAGNEIHTDYDNSGGATVSVTRGSSSLVTTVDGFGRPIGTTNSQGVQTSARYDEEGRKTFESLPFHGGEVGDSIDVDAIGRTRGRHHNDSTTVTTDYQLGPAGYDVRITDENGRTTIQHMTASGDPRSARLSGVTDANGLTWGYEYHVTGALRKAISPDSAVAPRELTYNSHNQLATETHPESGTTTYSIYDDAGNMKRKVDAAGTVFDYNYDDDNRLTNVSASGPLGSHVVEIGYEHNSNNRQQVVVDGGASLTFDYDDASRPRQRTETIHGNTLATLYTYDGDNLGTIQYPTGRIVAYTYDSEGQPVSVRDVTTAGHEYTFADGASYHASGALQSYLTGNGLVHKYDYDQSRYWTTCIQVSLSGNSQCLDGTSLLSISYENYDHVGNVRQIETRRGGAASSAETFTYDPLDRLATMDGHGAYGFGGFDYDAHGNRVSNAYGSYSYYPGTLRLQSQGQDTFGYDGNGNMTTATTSGLTTQYSYRPDNMMAQATSSAGTSSYEYDGDQQRVARTLGVGTAAQSTTLYSYGPAGQMLGEYLETAGGVAPVRDYIYLGSKLIASVDAPRPSVAFTTTGAVVSEGAGSVSATIVLTTPDGHPLNYDVTVDYSTVDGTATAGHNYVPLTGTLTFHHGSASGSTHTIAVTLIDDAVPETNEAFQISLSAPSAADLGLASFAVTMIDNEPRLQAGLWVGSWPLTSSTASGRFSVRGWALDVNASNGTGVDSVTVYAKQGAGSPIPLGTTAPTGPVPPDVEARLGQRAHTAGFGVGPVLLPLGTYDLYLTAHFTHDGSTQESPHTTITVIPETDLRRAGDFDGIQGTEVVAYNTSSGMWSMLNSGTNYTSATNRSWGGTGYQPVPGDYDGDGLTDYGLYVPATGNWYVLLSGQNFTTSMTMSAGGPGWTAVPGDYDGDGRTDFGVYNTTTGQWYVLKSSTGYTTSLSISYGGTGWTPVPADFDGDGRTDIGVYQASTGTWSIPFSSTNFTTGVTQYAGGATWIPVAADYDGDRKADIVVYDTATGVWYGLKSSTGYTTSINVSCGSPGDVPVKGDYDGDGKADPAVYTPSTGAWVIRLSSTNYASTLTFSWGGAGYVAVPQYP
jgi:YD repeat-containing protein